MTSSMPSPAQTPTTPGRQQRPDPESAGGAPRKQPSSWAAGRAPRKQPPSWAAGLVRVAAHVGSLIPGLLLGWDTATGGLSVDPVRDLTQRTGKDAFVLLVLSLAVGPAVRLTGLRLVSPLARTFGIYAFGYAALHLLVFVGVD